jgi:hypothetical protein
MMKNIQNKWRSVVPTVLPKPKRVVIDFPEPLLVEAERAAHELKINRSSLIREAVKQFLKRRQRIKLGRTPEHARPICSRRSSGGGLFTGKR